MASLKGSRTDQNLRHAFSDAVRLNRLARSSTQAAGGGHLDFLAAGYDTSPPSGNPLRSTVARLASANAAMTDDHTAMYAGVARTAHDEGIADWYETVARAGGLHAGDMRRALDNIEMNA